MGSVLSNKKVRKRLVLFIPAPAGEPLVLGAVDRPAEAEEPVGDERLSVVVVLTTLLLLVVTTCKHENNRLKKSKIFQIR